MPDISSICPPIIQEKIEILCRSFQQMGSALVAYSGGVDSTLLAYLATRELEKHVICATAVSPSLATVDLKRAKVIAQKLGFYHVLLETGELKDPRYLENSPDRCYWCKREIFRSFSAYAQSKKLAVVIDGTNRDDLFDSRPGLKAAREFRVRSPLCDAGFTKFEIRAAAKSFGLPNHEAPNRACLSSRIPYGTQIAEDTLRRIETAEDFLLCLGFQQVRLRDRGAIACIEVETKDFERLMDSRHEILNELRQLGYEHVTLDLAGYQAKSVPDRNSSISSGKEDNHGT